MLQLRGRVRRRLVLVAFAEEAGRGDVLVGPGGAAMGELLSSAEHPLENGVRLGFALVKVEVADAGTVLGLAGREAVVVEAPLIGAAL